MPKLRRQPTTSRWPTQDGRRTEQDSQQDDGSADDSVDGDSADDDSADDDSAGDVHVRAHPFRA